MLHEDDGYDDENYCQYYVGAVIALYDGVEVLNYINPSPISNYNGYIRVEYAAAEYALKDDELYAATYNRKLGGGGSGDGETFYRPGSEKAQIAEALGAYKIILKIMDECRKY